MHKQQEELIQQKKRFIEKQKQEFPEEFLKKALGGLLIVPADLYEFVNSGTKEAFTIEEIEDLYNITEKIVAVIDLTNKPYGAFLDAVGFAKHINEQLAVIVKDILLEEYQLYTFYMYNIDGVLFDLNALQQEELEKIVALAEVMGINLIPSISKNEDLKNIKRFEDGIRFVSTNNAEITKQIPENLKLVTTEKNINADLVIRGLK